jgi:hypothetical protein
VRVIHPFHPLAGEEFRFAFRRQTWGEDRVFFLDGQGDLRGLPAGWTDVAPVDPFVAVAAGRSALRVTDLLALADLLDGLCGNDAGSV